MKVNPSFAIFFAGMLPFLAAYYPLKDELSPWVFVGTAFVYMIAVRVLTDFLVVKFFPVRDAELNENEERDERDKN